MAPRLSSRLGLVLTLISVSVVIAQRYTGYHVIVVHSPGEADRQVLNQFFQENNVDVWNFPHVIGSDVTFALPPLETSEALEWLADVGMSAEVVIDDVQKVIDSEKADHDQAMRIGVGEFNLGVYNDHDRMNEFLQSKNERCDICELVRIGESYEGRDLMVLKIGDHVDGKKGIWIDAGIHAREWVAPAVALIMAERLVEGYLRGSADATRLIDSYVWYILPSVNPDGYMYSRTEDRLWRKTRQPNSGSSCVGTDPNRNWDFHWNEVGTSQYACSDIYAGPHAFSEPETQYLSQYLLSIAADLRVYLSFHSYGQYWLTPWGYNSDVPSDYDDLIAVGQAAVDKIQSISGRLYTLGSSTNVLYAAAGASDDWAKGVAHIPYSYTVELRDTGNYGFLLPEQGIRPTAREIWNGIVEMTLALDEAN